MTTHPSLQPPLTASSDCLLFTPGPLTTSLTVKQAMLHDVGSRDARFIALIRDIRRQLLELGDVSQSSGYEAVLMQGSGTFGVEAAIGSLIPEAGKLLILINGAYGERILKIAERLRLSTTVLRSPEHEAPDAAIVEKSLTEDSSITDVAMVHCETTTGILNPIEDIARVVSAAGRRLMVDAMSSFGAIPVSVGQLGIDSLISSANKCIEGVPGFSFVLARRDSLHAATGRARSLSLDLAAQWEGLERNGQFRFTPPTHALLAFDQALRELKEEGGIEGRANRYRTNHRTLLDGMARLGFKTYLAPERQSYIITAFHYPSHPQFNFENFYERLSSRGMVIYPGKLSQIDCFRIGSIGRITPPDLESLMQAIADVLEEMGIDLKG